MKKLIIDTDPGHDDALALMLIFKSGKFDIKAVTTVAGNSTIQNVTKNARAILNLVDEKNVPVFSGQANPIKRSLIKAVVHGDSGLDGLDVSQIEPRLTGNADDKIIGLVKKYPGQIRILTLGPLSNIARAFIKEPKLASLVKEIVIMGGAINVCGNKNRVAEFNMFVDPEAAEVVFKAEVKKILIPLDPCNEVVVPLSCFENLRGGKLYQPLVKMMKKFKAGLGKELKIKGVLVYDAIAAYYLIKPTVFDLKDMDVVIETKGEHTFGMTVAEKRERVVRNFNVCVAMKVDKKAFIKDYFEILKKR